MLMEGRIPIQETQVQIRLVFFFGYVYLIT
jgi:hypothetical protein